MMVQKTSLENIGQLEQIFLIGKYKVKACGFIRLEICRFVNKVIQIVSLDQCI